jgi:hypothetical protein
MYKQLVSESAPTQPRRQYRPKVSSLIITLILLVLGLQFVVLPHYVYQISPSQQGLNSFQLQTLDARLEQCREISTPPKKYPVTTAGSRTNPRWNTITGQNETIVLRNATLFDGETFLNGGFDITFKKGIIESVSATGSASIVGAKIVDLNGNFVTPGLVDMHSHHMAIAWPMLSSTEDGNEVHDRTEPITSQVRILGMHFRFHCL